MREFKLNSNNKHVATDWGLHVDLTVRADALHEPNVSLLWTLRTLLQDSMLHIKQIDAVSLRNVTRQVNAILSLSSFIFKRQQNRSPNYGDVSLQSRFDTSRFDTR